MKKKEVINRKQFLSKLGLGTGAIIATYCLGSFSSCKEDDSVARLVDFTLDLTDATYANLGSIGGYVRENNVVIAYVSEDTYVAVTQICSHQGAKNVLYNAATKNFYCTSHGAMFNLEGNGLNNNGSKGILLYNTSLSGTILRIFS